MIDPDNTTVSDEISFSTVKQYGAAAVNKFIELLEKGESVKMAEMLVTRTPPRLGITEHTYQRNRVSLLEQCSGSPVVLKQWQDQYRRETGEELPSDAILMRSLARHAGDREAVISHKHSLADVMRMARRRNLKVEGDWNIDPNPSIAPEVQKYRMDPALVETYVDEYIKDNPDMAEMSRNEIREFVVDKHSRKVDVDDFKPHGASNFKELAGKLFGKAT